MRLISISKAQQTRAPGWFMLTALLALLWNGIGMAQYIQHMSMTPDILALLPPEQAALYYGTPAWANGAFGLGVIGGTMGSVLLVMRRRLSVVFFSLSLGGIVVQQIHELVLARSAQVLGPGSLVTGGVVVLVAVFLVLLSFKARMKGWTH